MNILVLGATGNISFQFVNYALSVGWHITTISRGSTHYARRKLIHSNKIDHFFDIKNTDILNRFLLGKYYDLVVDFICYDEIDAINRVSCFSKKTGSYIFISTTASYSKKPVYLPYTEETPVNSLDWDYCRKKVNAENVFLDAKRKKNFPIIIVRLAHTYDTVIPVAVGPADWTVPKRILEGKPVVVHGDGTTIWTLIHATDVARALLGLGVNKKAVGEIFNVVSNERVTWNEITTSLFKILEKPPNLCYVSSKKINTISSYLGNGIIGHKMWNDFYDNTKTIDFLDGWHPQIGVEDGLQQSINWYLADTQRQHVSNELDTVLENLCLESNGIFYG
jgi:nucleoside-diphosphate-sugar epimerase